MYLQFYKHLNLKKRIFISFGVDNVRKESFVQTQEKKWKFEELKKWHIKVTNSPTKVIFISFWR